jgi:guanylate kinase
MSYSKVIIFSAPSGAGKTTLVRHLLNEDLPLAFSISACSRSPRKGEIDAKDYHFLSINEFQEKINSDQFFEWEEVYKDMFYGTLKSEVEKIWSQQKCVVFDVDVVGGIKLKEIFGDKALSIFVGPPSLQVLRDRLSKRGTETKEEIEKRLAKAQQELQEKDKFDVLILNNSLEKAVSEMLERVTKFLN